MRRLIWGNKIPSVVKWEFSSMMTVSLVLVFTAISGDVARQIDAITTSQVSLNILFGLGFFIPGIIGGMLNESEAPKAVLMITLSFIVIGGITALNLYLSGENDWVLLAFQGIPTSMVETSFGFGFGYKIREYYFQKQQTTDISE